MSNLFVNTIAPQSGSNVNLSGSMKITGNLEVTGTLHAKTTDFIVSANSTTFGDAASDSLTINAATASVPNGLNFDTNTLVINSTTNRVGVGVAAPTTTLDVNGTVNATTFTGGSLSSTGDLTVGDDLFLQSDSAVLNFGADDDVNLTHTADTGLHLNAGMRLAFRDQGGEYVHSVSDGNLGVVAATSIDLKSPQIDIGEDDASDVTINLLGSTNDMAIVYDESTKKLSFDSTDLVIDAANAKVGIGTSAPSAQLDVHDTTTSSATTGGKIRVSANDGQPMGDSHRLGVVEFTGAEDSSNTQVIGARIEALTDGAWTNVNNPTALYFYVNKGDNTAPLALKLDNNQKATFSGEIAAVSLDISGDVAADGKVVLGVDADANDTTANSATGRLGLGASEDLNLYHNTNSYVVNNTGDLIIATEGSNGAGIILDAEDDTVEIKYSGVLGATFDGDGLDLVTGDAYQINGASVLNATTLGSAVVNSSLTSVGTLTALQVDNININGATITSDTTATIDATGDIALSADGGNVTMDDGTTTIFDFDVDGTILTIHDDEDTGDKFSITVAQHGATTITTVDDDAAAAHLVITADGTVDIDSAGTMTLDSGANIHLEPAAGSHILLDGTIQVDAGVVTGATSITTKELSVLSGDSGTLSKIVMGLDTSKATIGVAQATDTFFTDTAAGDIVVRADDNNNKVHIGAGTSGIAGMVVTEVSNVGKVGIGVADPDAMLEVFGTTTQLKISNNVNDFATMAVGTHGDLTITTVDNNAAAADLTLTIDGDIIMTPAGGDVKITGTNPKLTIGDAGAEDTMIVFDGNAQDFRIGLDDGTDTLEIGHGTTHGTNTAITVDSSGQITKLNVPAATIDEASDHILFFDGGATGAPKVESVDDFLTAIAGSGVSVSSSQLTVSAASSAADDITAGDAAVTITTTSGNITIDAAANDSDIILKGTDGGVDTTFLTIDGSEAGAATFNSTVTTGDLITSTKDVDGEFVALKLTNQSDAADTTGVVSLQFDLEDTSGNAVDSAKIAVKKEASFTSTAGTQDSSVVLSTSKNGTLTEQVTLDSNGDLILANGGITVPQYVNHAGDADTRLSFTDDKLVFEIGGVNLLKLEEAGQDTVVFNEDGGDVDFRVESNNETHMIFMEASTNRVSIGDSTNSPTATLEITNHASSGATGVPLVQLNSNDVDQVSIDVNAANTTANVLDIAANALTSGKGIFIDHDNSATTAVTPVGIHVDFDKSGVTGDGVTSTFTGLDIDINDGATNHANADVTQTGAAIAVASTNATGTTLNLGMQISATGADENIQLALVDDGSVIAFGADSEITLTHVHNEGLILEAAATNTPILEIKNTHNGGTAGILKFNNTEGGNDGADNDKLGSVEFHGNDDGTPSAQQYAGIVAEIHDATSDNESGKLTLQVASHDGGVEPGLVLVGGSENAEVDVEIGNGSASLTTVMGDLQINGGDVNSPSGGGLNVAPSLDDGQSLKLGKNGAVEVIITPHGTAANEIYSVTNTAGTAATAIAMTSTAGGISLTAETNHGVTISTSTPDAAGAGVNSAVGVTTTISKVNGIIETVILVDFSGLTTQATNLRIIGDGTNSYLTKITHEKNGYIYRAEVGCIETPAGGATVCTDIDLVADTTARASGYDLGSNSSDLIVVNAGGSWAIGKWEPSNVAPAGGASLTDGLDEHFLMLASGADTGGASGVYNAGKFVIKLYGASF